MEKDAAGPSPGDGVSNLESGRDRSAQALGLRLEAGYEKVCG